MTPVARFQLGKKKAVLKNIVSVAQCETAAASGFGATSPAPPSITSNHSASIARSASSSTFVFATTSGVLRWKFVIILLSLVVFCGSQPHDLETNPPEETTLAEETPTEAAPTEESTPPTDGGE